MGRSVLKVRHCRQARRSEAGPEGRQAEQDNKGGSQRPLAEQLLQHDVVAAVGARRRGGAAAAARELLARLLDALCGVLVLW